MTVAVLIPCFNEEKTICKVIKDFQLQLPDSDIYVYNNNSTDNSAILAEQQGAIVRSEYRQGKGNVLRTMFSDIDADIYVLVDGDDTYPAESVHMMITEILNGHADMVCGDRLSNGTYSGENTRRFHNFGNLLVRKIINCLFKSNIQDVMTGYRAFNKQFVKNYAVLSKGFEVETEMTIHALDKNFKIREVPIRYRDRPEGSVSKLNTTKDGIKVVKTIFHLFKSYKPLPFFLCCSLFLFFLGFGIGIPVIVEFIKCSYIKHIPLAILAASVEVLASLSLVCGLILDTIVRNAKFNYELRLIDYKGGFCKIDMKR